MEAIIPNIAELIPALIAFLIIFLILNKFAFPAIVGMLDKRSDTIREGLERVEAARVEAERLLEEYRHTMSEARKEAGVIKQQAKQSAEVTRLEMAAKAQAEYDAMLEKAKEAIEGEKRAAIAGLQSSVAELTISVASRLIGSELSDDEHMKVVEKYLAEAGSLNAN